MASREALAGSFELQVEVEEGDAGGQGCPIADPSPTAAPRTLALRVTGDLHVGGLMLLIAQSIGAPRDWSDHALWWWQRGQWLLCPSHSLDALGVGADAHLLFTPRHRALRLRLPNHLRLRLRLCFARPSAHAVAQACALLGLGPPEELSLLRPPEEEEERGGQRGSSAPSPAPPDFDLSHLPPPQVEDPAAPPPPPLPPEVARALLAPWGGLDPIAPPRPSRGDPLLRRTRLHARWVDSSRSLWAQGLREDTELLLRFRFPCGLDLDPQRDGRRLALLFEQGRWALLTEELDCTEEEMMLFAALQYHIDEVGEGSTEPGDNNSDDLDTALSKLELKLGGGPDPPEALQEEEPEAELAEELEIYRPPRLLRGFRPAWVQLKGATLALGHSPPAPGGALQHLNLHGSEVTPEVDLGAQRFCIKLRVPAPTGVSEVTLRCRGAPQFARWLAGCRAAAQGVSLRPSVLAAEAQGVLGVLGVQGEGPGAERSPQTPPAPPRPPPDPRRLLPPRLQRKVKAKQFAPRILGLLGRLGPLPPGQARLRFLRELSALPQCGLACFLVRLARFLMWYWEHWQYWGGTGSAGGLSALPQCSLTCFLMRFQGARRDEVLALGPSQLLRVDPGSGTTRAWHWAALRQWDVNWESQQVTLQLEGEVTLALRVRSASCRTLHEFLGGFLCLGGGGHPRDPQLLQRLLGGGDPL